MSVDDSFAVLETYLNITFSFTQGVIRIWAAEAALAPLLCASDAFRALDQPTLEEPFTALLQHLARVPHNAAESLAYVTNASHLVYAAALFDTFLSETTHFLFLLHPQAMGGNQPVPLRALIDEPSRNEAVTQAVIARAREIGDLPFAVRIQLLREALGLEISLSAETEEGLARFPTVRDSAVRQGCHLHLDSRGRMVSRRNTSRHVASHRNLAPHQTENISNDDTRRAIDSYEQAARVVASAVFRQILKQDDHPAVQLVLNGSTVRLDLRAS